METVKRRRTTLSRRNTQTPRSARPVLEAEVYRRIVVGRMDDLPPLNSRVVRIFLSSTFSDMACERNILMKKIYPKLKDYCREHHGIEFQVMLGQKYGSHPPPYEMLHTEFHALRHSLLEAGHSTQLLDACYDCDENNIPVLYILRPVLENVHEATPEEIDAAKRQWRDTEPKLLRTLNTAAELCLQSGKMQEDELSKFFCSVTENEIRRGLFEAPDQLRKYCSVFLRIIDNLENFLDHSKIGKFLDVEEANGESGRAVDKMLNEMMNRLRDTNLLKSVPHENVCSYKIQWQDGLSPQTHKQYLKQFADDFYERTVRLIDRSVADQSQYSEDDVYVEILQHLSACKGHVQQFQGRQEILDRVKEYVMNDNDQPLVIHGESGCGKTSVLAKSASLARSWLPDEEPAVLVRFLGTSPATSNINQSLKSLCLQLASLSSPEAVSDCRELETFQDVGDKFYTLLRQLGAERRILLFLDSEDQLDSSNGAFHLTWLHTQLPRGVKMVLSPLPHLNGILKMMRGKLPDDRHYVEVKALEQALCRSILDALLTDRGRRLTPAQWELVQASTERCSLPIFVNLICRQVQRWRSFQDGLEIAGSVRGAIVHLFEFLERNHGKVFTRHALGYITASRNGLSESELDDLLSLDDQVLCDVFQYHLPPFIRVPPLCWARLRHDIGAYLVVREADSTRVLNWYHRQFWEVANAYLFSDASFRRAIHSRMADYFLDVWGMGKEKPFAYPDYLVQKLKLPPETAADRMVPAQPLLFEEGETVRFNLRKLNELPYHLVRADRLSEFFSEVAFNFDFLYDKLSGTSRYHLLRDLALPSDHNVASPAINLLHNAVRSSALSLTHDAASLVVDLMARLFEFEGEHAQIADLLGQCRRAAPELCALMPTVKGFESGSGLSSVTFDIGMAAGFVVPSGLLLACSVTTHELTWYDLDGNVVKRGDSGFSSDSLVTGLMPRAPLRRDEYTVCFNDDDVQTKGPTLGRFNVETGVLSATWEIPDEWKFSASAMRVLGDKFVCQMKTTFTGSSYDEPSTFDLSIVSLVRKEIIYELETCFGGTSVMPADERLVYVTVREGQTDVLVVVDLESGKERRSPWKDRFIHQVMYMRAEMVVFFSVHDNEAMEMCILETEKVLNDDFTALHSQIVADKCLSNRVTREAIRAVSEDYNLMLYRMNYKMFPRPRKFLNGLVFHRRERRVVWLNHNMEETQISKDMRTEWYKQAISANYFTPDNRFLYTSTQDCLLMVWDTNSGALLRQISSGKSLAIMSGIHEGRFVLNMLPDSSDTAVQNARTYFLAKVFNTVALNRAEENDQPAMVPTVERNVRLDFYLSTKFPSVFVCYTKQAAFVYDVGKRSTLLFSEKVDRSEPLFQQYVEFQPNLEGCIEVGDLSLMCYRYSVGRSIFNLQDAEGNVIRKTAFYDCCIRKLYGNSYMFAMAQMTRVHGFLDEQQRRVVFFHTKASRCVVRLQNLLLQDLVTPGKVCIPKVPQFDPKQHPDVFSDNRKFRRFTVAQIVPRPAHPGQVFILLAEKADILDVSVQDKRTFWPGYVLLVDYSGISEVTDEEGNLPLQTNAEAVSMKASPVFDTGKSLSFLPDGQHALNYRLQIVNVLDGTKLREVVPDSEGLIFAATLLAPDQRFVVVLRVERPKEMGTIRGSGVTKQYMRVMPRIIQIYRMEDGKRLANYMLPMDPHDLILCNDGRTLVVLIMNEPLIIFDLVFEADIEEEQSSAIPDTRSDERMEEEPLTENKKEISKPHESRGRSGEKQPHLKNSRQKKNREGRQNKKQSTCNDYLQKSNLHEVLSNALAEVVENRPTDPIAFLAYKLKELS